MVENSVPARAETSGVEKGKFAVAVAWKIIFQQNLFPSVSYSKIFDLVITTLRPVLRENDAST